MPEKRPSESYKNITAFSEKIKYLNRKEYGKV
jgi:hypothetical protein